MSEANKATMRDILRMLETGNTDGIESLVAANAVDHQGIPGVDTQGAEGFKRMIEIMHTAYPNMHIHIEDLGANRVHQHLTPGKGAMDFPAIFEAVEKVGYRRPVTVELYPYETTAAGVAKRAYDHLRPMI